MNKFIVVSNIIGVLVFAAEAIASGETGNCLDQIAHNQHWRTLSDQTRTCLSTDPDAKSDFGDAMTYLCSKDRSRISNKYKLFLETRQTYIEAYEALKLADSASRNEALFNLTNAEWDWRLRGNREDVFGYINRISRAHDRCE